MHTSHREKHDNTWNMLLWGEGGGALATLKVGGCTSGKGTRKKREKSRFKLRNNRGVCDSKEGVVNHHYCHKWENNELAWSMVVCGCIVADGQMGKRKQWQVVWCVWCG